MSIDLTTTYLKLKLANPLVVAPCPLTERLDMLYRFEEAGASAIVLPSLFEEQIRHDELQLHKLQLYGSESFPEALVYFPELDDYNTGPDRYLQHITQAKRAVRIPIIASLNGATVGGWTDYARRMQDAGADALELNIYLVAANPDLSSEEVESQYLSLVSAVRQSVSIPLAIKIGPFFSSLAHMARRLIDAGADGLVLFNRFLQPDIDLETMEVVPNLVLSRSDELRLPLRWIAILSGRVDGSLAATSGAHSALDVIKLILAGADVVMSASTYLKQGPGHVGMMLQGIRDWMEEYEYTSIEQMKGSMSQRHSPNPSAFERSNYIKTLTSYTSDLA